MVSEMAAIICLMTTSFPEGQNHPSDCLWVSPSPSLSKRVHKKDRKEFKYANIKLQEMLVHHFLLWQRILSVVDEDDVSDQQSHLTLRTLLWERFNSPDFLFLSSRCRWRWREKEGETQKKHLHTRWVKTTQNTLAQMAKTAYRRYILRHSILDEIIHFANISFTFCLTHILLSCECIEHFNSPPHPHSLSVCVCLWVTVCVRKRVMTRKFSWIKMQRNMHLKDKLSERRKSRRGRERRNKQPSSSTW